MKAVAVFLLFMGMILILQGYYSQKTKCPPPEIQVKFVPRSIYEEQLSDDQKLSQQFKGLFEDIDPWNNLVVGSYNPNGTTIANPNQA